MRKNAIITFIIIAVIIILGLLYISHVKKQNENNALNTSEAANALRPSGGQYTDLAGNPRALSDYLGQKIVVFSWASWCPQCVDQLQLLNSYNKSDDTVILAINRAEPPLTAKSFLEFYKVDQKVELILDSGDHFYKTIGGYGMPVVVIYDEKGRLLFKHDGNISLQKIKQELGE